MIKYTVINHEARIKYGLTMLEYSVLDSYGKLSNKPDYEYSQQSKTNIANFFGCSRRYVITIVKKLVEKGLLLENNYGKLKATQIYYDEFELSINNTNGKESVNKVHRCEQSSQQVGTKFTLSVNKVHTKCEQSSHNNNIYNNNNNIINKKEKNIKKEKDKNNDFISSISGINNFPKDVIEKFEQFWNQYPKKTDKGKVRVLFNQVIRSGIEFEKILFAVEEYKKQYKYKESRQEFNPEYKSPYTWLQNECWEDEYVYAEKLYKQNQEKKKKIREQIKKDQEKRYQEIGKPNFIS